MTRLLSAYPKKFHNQLIFFFSTNFIPFHLKETTQSITQIVRILSCHILIYRQISMVTPKATNDHFPAKNTKFSRKEFIRPNSCETRGLDQIMTTFHEKKNTKFSRQEFIQPYHCEIRGLDQNCVNVMYFQVSRPIPMPPQRKNLQLVEFRPTSAIAHN